jgi:hypothetical protein
MLAFKSFSRRQVNVIQPPLDESLFRIVSTKSHPSGLTERPLRLAAADIYVALRKRNNLFAFEFRVKGMNFLQRPVSVERIHVDRLVQ